MSKAAFIIGGGPRVGTSVANALAAKGYKVAVGRRSPDTNGLASGIQTVKIDVSETLSITNAFEEVRSAIGTPNVVVFNPAVVNKVAPKEDPFSIDTEYLAKDSQTNIFGVYTALMEAVRGFKSVDAALPKVFIVTGNILPWAPAPFLFSPGVGKAAAAHLMHVGAETEAYQKAGYRFYYASEVTKDGGPQYGGISGEAHAKTYLQLIETKEQGPWEVRFVA